MPGVVCDILWLVIVNVYIVLYVCRRDRRVYGRISCVCQLVAASSTRRRTANFTLLLSVVTEILAHITRSHIAITYITRTKRYFIHCNGFARVLCFPSPIKLAHAPQHARRVRLTLRRRRRRRVDHWCTNMCVMISAHTLIHTHIHTHTRQADALKRVCVLHTFH